MLAGALNVFTPAQRYFGYFPGNALHSPTTVLVRPLSLALFAAVAAARLGARALTARGVRALAVLTVLCALAKPSFVICLAPALALTWLGERRSWRAWWPATLAVCVPAAIVVGWQAWFTPRALASSSIVVRPFDYLALHTDVRPGSLAFKLVLSVLFPLAVALCYAPRAWRDPALRLAWITFAVGVIEAYLLADTGARRRHGNFSWGAQLSAFVLFAASAHWLARQPGQPGDAAERRRFATCAAVLLAHATAGLMDLHRFASAGAPFRSASADWYIVRAP
jgi:hypothetical protein